MLCSGLHWTHICEACRDGVCLHTAQLCVVLTIVNCVYLGCEWDTLGCEWDSSLMCCFCQCWFGHQTCKSVVSKITNNGVLLSLLVEVSVSDVWCWINPVHIRQTQWYVLYHCMMPSYHWLFLFCISLYYIHNLPYPIYSAGLCKSNVSVRPSVTHRYCVKTKKASVMISSPSGSPTILVLWCQISSRHSKGFPRAGA